MKLNEYFNYWSDNYLEYYHDKNAHAHYWNDINSYSQGIYHGRGDGYTLRCYDVNLIFNL